MGSITDRHYLVKIPAKINKHITIRLRGLGRTKANQTGDLLLHVWLNKGEDIQKSLWLSDSSARNGAEKKLLVGEKKIIVVIPPKSHHGLTIRLKGLGLEPDFNWRVPFLHRRRGNLLVKLFVYPDKITPKYRSFDMLSTESMALEGWVYRKIGEVTQKLGQSSFPTSPIRADAVADLFNEHGWRCIFDAFLRHLQLTQFHIALTQSKAISLPGSCQRNVSYQNNTPVAYNYLITINEQFLDNPFSVAAILAHELCHVVYTERIDDTPKSVGYRILTERDSLETERTVDLLVFMFKIGEFQLRVARDERFTLGYFNQELFERMQVIVSRKLCFA